MFLLGWPIFRGYFSLREGRSAFARDFFQLDPLPCVCFFGQVGLFLAHMGGVETRGDGWVAFYGPAWDGRALPLLEIGGLGVRVCGDSFRPCDECGEPWEP